MATDSLRLEQPNGDEHSETSRIHRRLKDIHKDLMALGDRRLALELETESLFLRLREITSPTPIKQRPRGCYICKRPTLEMFGDRPQCLRHVAGGDVAINDILADFLRS